jgi:hypothetical protein
VIDEAGNEIRQVMSGVFEGKAGLVLLAFKGAVESWTQTGVDYFIQSIR